MNCQLNFCFLSAYKVIVFLLLKVRQDPRSGKTQGQGKIKGLCSMPPKILMYPVPAGIFFTARDKSCVKWENSRNLMQKMRTLVYAITLTRGAYILVEVDSAHVSAPLRETSVKHRPSMKKSFRTMKKSFRFFTTIYESTLAQYGQSQSE